MTKFPHDQFAKEYLQKLLSPLGEVETSKDVTAEVREIDVFFQPTSVNSEYIQSLGLLGKMATTVAIIEPFRNAVNTDAIFSCVVKLLNSRADLLRKVNREDQRLESTQLPFLWILTPTASESLLNSFGFQIPEESKGWGRGVYFLSEVWRVGLIAIHQLPKVSETMWLRMLGKGKVQQEAIAQLTGLPADHPLRTNALELLYNLQANLQANLVNNPEGEQEDQELAMAIVPLFREHLQAAQQQGREEGRQEGRQEGIEQGLELGKQEQQRLILENFIQVKFGEVPPKMAAFLSAVSTLPTGEFTAILLSISMLTVDEFGCQQGTRLLAENVVRMRWNEGGEFLATVVTSLLELPVEKLILLLAQLPQLSREEFMVLLGENSGVN
ncbi:flagellar assembly protein H [Oscillatoriales cyanobacterium USR001]|nr:flagellar assembly protein H [Oscillatoriales cyanobacterium USR001]